MKTLKSTAEHIRFYPFPLAQIDPMSATTARSFPRHTHDQYGIGMVDAGGHASWSGRGQVEAGPGSFICVNPGEVHDGQAIGRQVRSWRMLYFEPTLMEQTRRDILEDANTFLTFAAPVFADDSMRRSFDTVFAYASAAPRETMACETAVLNLVARLGVHSTCSNDNQQSTACIRRARSRIDDDPAAPLTLVDLAKEVDLSRYQLIRGFARELGLPPHAYILQRRIALARRLIRSGRALAEVAAMAGFYDQSHLTRCFVRQFGVTPSRYAAATFD